MTIIGIDGSTTCTGYSVFNNTSLIDYGAVRPIGDNWRDRLVDEGAQIRHILEKYNPDNKNIELTIKLQNSILKVDGHWLFWELSKDL